MSVGANFALYFKTTTQVVHRCKIQQQRCSYGREIGRRRRYTVVNLPFFVRVKHVDEWGHAVPSAEAATAAAWLRKADFGSRCASSSPNANPRNVAVILVGRMRVKDAAHEARLRNDLDGCTVFAATFALPSGSRIVLRRLQGGRRKSLANLGDDARGEYP